VRALTVFCTRDLGNIIASHHQPPEGPEPAWMNTVPYQLVIAPAPPMMQSGASIAGPKF
jgi:hypothetical protein